MSIYKIVITGGPCAGKTTAMEEIKRHFEGKGFVVLFIEETATQLISTGVTPLTCATPVTYQRFQIRLQLTKESIYEEAAKGMAAENILIVCDRGMMDNSAYMKEEEFESILKENNKNRAEIMNSYDAIFHMSTAAKGAEEFYTTANNSARTETIEEARLLDDRLIEAWSDHKYFRIIDNSSTFDAKISRLIKEIEEIF